MLISKHEAPKAAVHLLLARAFTSSPSNSNLEMQVRHVAQSLAPHWAGPQIICQLKKKLLEIPPSYFLLHQNHLCLSVPWSKQSFHTLMLHQGCLLCLPPLNSPAVLNYKWGLSVTFPPRDLGTIAGEEAEGL